MPLFLKSIAPEIDIFGNRQLLNFNKNSGSGENDSALTLINWFTPIFNVDTNSAFEFLTPAMKGFRFNHSLSAIGTFGNFNFEKYDRFGIVESLWAYDELLDCLVFFKPLVDLKVSTPPIDNFDVVNKFYVDNKLWTSAQIIDFDEAVRDNYLNSFLQPILPVNLGNQRIINLASPILNFDAATKEYVDSKMPNFPGDHNFFLSGDGYFYDPLNVITNLSSFQIAINNVNYSSVASELAFYKNGSLLAQFGLNNSSNEAYIWATNGAAIKFGTSGTTRFAIYQNGTIDVFNNRVLGLLDPYYANEPVTLNYLNAKFNWFVDLGYAINSSKALVIDGSWYGGYAYYGFLNSSGNVGTSISDGYISIQCAQRVRASEFNAISSIKKKKIISSGVEIEHEAIELLKQIKFSKYQYIDQHRDGSAICYGVIAEELQTVLPGYVEAQSYDFVPSIMQKCKVKKSGVNEYNVYINFTDVKIDTHTKKMKIITEDQSVDVEIVDINEKYIKIKSKESIKKEVFAYGTYEICPSVSKQKLFELSMLVVQNLLKRIEILETKEVVT
jgi:hypothetical protein